MVTNDRVLHVLPSGSAGCR